MVGRIAYPIYPSIAPSSFTGFGAESTMVEGTLLELLCPTLSSNSAPTRTTMGCPVRPPFYWQLMCLGFAMFVRNKALTSLILYATE